MNRRLYIYWALPLFVLLGCGRNLAWLVGSGALMLAIALPLILLTWGVVWLRLYRSKLLRPELAVLAILPQSLYFAAKYTGFHANTHSQTLFVLAWLGFAFVVIESMRTGEGEPPKRASKDAVFLLMCAAVVLYASTTMAQYALDLFY